MPNEMVDIASLRALNLNETWISNLPDSTYSISSLRALFITNCDNISKMLAQMGRLTRLLHLSNYRLSNRRRRKGHLCFTLPASSPPNETLLFMGLLCQAVSYLRSLEADISGNSSDGEITRYVGKKSFF